MTQHRLLDEAASPDHGDDTGNLTTRNSVAG